MPHHLKDIDLTFQGDLTKPRKTNVSFKVFFHLTLWGSLLSSHLSFFLTLNKAQPWSTSPCTHITTATDSSYDRNHLEDLISAF